MFDSTPTPAPAVALPPASTITLLRVQVFTNEQLVGRPGEYRAKLEVWTKPVHEINAYIPQDVIVADLLTVGKFRVFADRQVERGRISEMEHMRLFGYTRLADADPDFRLGCIRTKRGGTQYNHAQICMFLPDETQAGALILLGPEQSLSPIALIDRRAKNSGSPGAARWQGDYDPYDWRASSVG